MQNVAYKSSPLHTSKISPGFVVSGEKPTPGACVVLSPSKRVQGLTKRNDVFLGDFLGVINHVKLKAKNGSKNLKTFYTPHTCPARGCASVLCVCTNPCQLCTVNICRRGRR